MNGNAPAPLLAWVGAAPLLGAVGDSDCGFFGVTVSAITPPDGLDWDLDLDLDLLLLLLGADLDGGPGGAVREDSTCPVGALLGADVVLGADVGDVAAG